MFDSESVSGFFGDLPYFSPVESSTFFDLVGSHGLHKLSEKLMTGSRTLEYFVEPGDTALQKSLLASETFHGRKRGVKASAFRFPVLKQRLDSDLSVSSNSSVCTIEIKETPSRGLNAARANISEAEQRLIQLNFRGIDAIWTALINNNLGVKVTRDFVLPNVDLCIAEESGRGELLLSVLLVGIKSIVDYFTALAPESQESYEPCCLHLTVLADEFGKTHGDVIQAFTETVFQIPVRRSFCDDVKSFLSTDDVTQTEAKEEREWLENVRSCAADAHENLCDEMDDRQVATSRLPSPIILVITPSQEAIRRPLNKALLDSYSSEPIRVTEDNEWTLESFAGQSPVMLLCSTSWINHEACTGGFDQLLQRLDVRCVIHGGFCEYGSSLREELASTLSLLQEQMCDDCPVFVHQHAHCAFSPKHVYALNHSSEFQCANVLLLLFRRFLLHYSPESSQPYFSLSRSFFISRKSWELYLRVIDDLTLSGATKKVNDSVDTPTVELTVLGRFLSFRFRISTARCQNALPPQEFSAQDVKTILWSHLFRQSRGVVEEIISANYIFADWVKSSLDKFCEDHHLALQSVSDIDRSSLVRQLSRFGFSQSSHEIESRSHFLLSAPFGKRTPLRIHVDGAPSTTSRGWYDQAPLRMGLSVEKRQVPVFCLPSSGLYCEIQGPQTGESFLIQCPTEVSYPLIVAHSALHISLHNNCVFLESSSENNPVPLPLSLLQSHTMSSILESTDFGEVGLWLDGVLSDKTLAPSDASMFRHLLQHKPSVIGLCERSPFRRKRKRAEEAAKTAPEREKFTGVKPHSLTEEDTIESFTKLVAAVGRDKAELSLKKKKGFGFLEISHELHPYYLYVLKSKEGNTSS